jgi:hypothetical protein
MYTEDVEPNLGKLNELCVSAVQIDYGFRRLNETPASKERRMVNWITMQGRNVIR